MAHIRFGRSRFRRARALLVVSAVAFSLAGLFTREAPVDLPTMVFWRNLFGSAALLVVLVARHGRIDRPAWRRGWRGTAAVVLSSASMVLYLAAFAHTSVANISIIYATAPMITAAGAWIALGERMSRRTLGAATVALVGVVLTVSGSVGHGGGLGDGLALAMTLCLAAVAILTRAAAVPPLETACASALLAAVAVLAFSAVEHAPLTVTLTQAGWLAAFGLASMAVALPCYFAGAAALPAGQAMLISTLELPMAPFWVWIAFDERPGGAALLGGSLVLAAVLIELAWPDRTDARSLAREAESR